MHNLIPLNNYIFRNFSFRNIYNVYTQPHRKKYINDTQSILLYQIFMILYLFSNNIEWIGHVCKSSKEKDPRTQMIIFTKLFVWIIQEGCETEERYYRGRLEDIELTIL